MQRSIMMCPGCHEQITVLLRDGLPDPRQVPHCYTCSICQQMKRTAAQSSKIRPLREGGGWYFICHNCKSQGLDA